MLAAAAVTEATALADQRRNQLAADLERLAMDIRVEHYSPTDVVVVLLEPQHPVLGIVGEPTWATLNVARDALQDALHARHGDGKVQDAMESGAARRQARQAAMEQKFAAEHVERPYPCPHCSERFKSVRGRDQHVANQLRLGCISCGVSRCTTRGGSYDYSDHYRGRYTCSNCLRAAKQ